MDTKFLLLVLLALAMNPGHSPCLDVAVEASRILVGVSGFAPPSWEGLANGVRPPPRQPEDFEPGTQRKRLPLLSASSVTRIWFGRVRESTGEVAEWAWVRGCVVCGAIELPHPYSFPFVSRFIAPTTPPSTPPLPAFVPMWPPTRLVWPPSCSVCSGGMVGEAGVCSGISGRWPRHDEHARQRVGFARASCRRSQTGGRCGRPPALRGRNWPSTPLWCQSSIATAQPDPEPPMKMASSWQLRGRGRSGPILSWWVPVPEHGLWFWLARLQAGGLKRPGHLSASSRRLAGGMSRQSSEGGRNKHGGCDGCPFLAAAQRRLSPVLCSTSRQEARTVRLLAATK